MKRPLLRKDQSIKWMLRGVLFIPILILVDYFYRQHRGAGTTTETLLMVFVIICVIGILQAVVGLHAWLKHRILDKEQGPE